MHLLQSRPCHTSLKDPIVLFRIHIQRLFVNRSIILDLVHRCLSMLLLAGGRFRNSRLLYKETMRRGRRDSSRSWGRMTGRVGGTGLVVGLRREERLVNMGLVVR